MATKTFYFSGLIKWAKRQKDDRYNNWTINLYPDAEAKAAIKASGLQIRPKEDPEEKLFYTFRRPESKLIKGETVEFGPPKFLIKNSDDQMVEFEGLIGNGSHGTVKVSVFDVPATGGKGHRYEAVCVDQLIEYVPQNLGDGGTTAAGAQLPPPF